MYLSGTSMAAGSRAHGGLLIEASRKSFGVKPTPNTIKAMLMHAAFLMNDAQACRTTCSRRAQGAQWQRSRHARTGD